jgi:hypothetical protein
LKKLLRANETLLARTAIAEHRARNLQQALQIEKKKRKRGKKLNLADKEVACGQWWGVSEIMEARAKLEEKTAMEMAQAAEKEQKKVDREIKKRQQEEEKKLRVLQRNIEQQAKAEKKAQAAAQKTAKKLSVKAKRSGKNSCIVILRPKQAFCCSLLAQEVAQDILPIAEGGGAQITSRSGRKITLSLRARQ